jgi:hypothetical protein
MMNKAVVSRRLQGMKKQYLGSRGVVSLCINLPVPQVIIFEESISIDFVRPTANAFARKMVVASTV